MLEGQPVHLSAPKTHYAKDLGLDKDTPIFCTSSTQIRYISQGAINERETEMMEVRWKVFSFYKQIPEDRQREITPCGVLYVLPILFWMTELGCSTHEHTLGDKYNYFSMMT